MKIEAVSAFSRLFPVFVVIFFLFAATAHSTDGPQFRLPNATAKLKSGWVLDVDGRGIDSNGYRPIRITITTLRGRPVTADHQVRVVLGCNTDDYRHVTRVSQVIEISEGSTSA